MLKGPVGYESGAQFDPGAVGGYDFGKIDLSLQGALLHHAPEPAPYVVRHHRKCETEVACLHRYNRCLGQIHFCQVVADDGRILTHPQFYAVFATGFERRRQAPLYRFVVIAVGEAHIRTRQVMDEAEAILARMRHRQQGAIVRRAQHIGCHVRKGRPDFGCFSEKNGSLHELARHHNRPGLQLFERRIEHKILSCQATENTHRRRQEKSL